MFCWQCEQTSDGTGCVRSGVCGKTGRISALADLLSVGVKRLALAAKAKRSSGRPDREADRLLIKGLTVNSTGMSFDSVSLSALIGDVEACFERIAGELGESFWKGPDFKLSETVSRREEQGAELPLGSFPEIEERLSPQVV